MVAYLLIDEDSPSRMHGYVFQTLLYNLVE